MAITQEQLNQTKETINNIQKITSQLHEVLVTVDKAILQDEDGVIIVSLTSNQKSQLLSEYNNIKTKLVTAFNELP